MRARHGQRINRTEEKGKGDMGQEGQKGQGGEGTRARATKRKKGRRDNLANFGKVVVPHELQ